MRSKVTREVVVTPETSLSLFELVVKNVPSLALLLWVLLPVFAMLLAAFVVYAVYWKGGPK